MSGRADSIRTLGPEAIAAVLATAPPPEDLLEWLADLCVLRGVPLEALVPDPTLLPPDSIRFFALDNAWIDALLDGALSPAAGSRFEATLLDALDDRVRADARARASRRRTGSGSPGPIWSGFLLRSAAVADFPGLTARAWRDPARTTPLGLLRLDAVAPAVLLGLFDGPLGCLELATPPQALHFGFALGASPGTMVLELRALDGDATGSPVGTLELGAGEPWLRPNGRRVVAIAELARRVRQALGSPPAFGAGSLALQMVDAAQAQSFVAEAAGG